MIGSPTIGEVTSRSIFWSRSYFLSMAVLTARCSDVLRFGVKRFDDLIADNWWIMFRRNASAFDKNIVRA